MTEVYVDSLQRLWITHNKGFSVCDNGVSKHFANSALAGVSPQCIVEGKTILFGWEPMVRGLLKLEEMGMSLLRKRMD